MLRLDDLPRSVRVSGDVHELRGGYVTLDRRLDRLPQFDPRSRNFAAADLFGSTLPTTKKVWPIYLWNDQGQEGACVGFSEVNEVNAQPNSHKLPNEYGRAVYKKAQTIDEWAGESYSGTSVLAGTKVMQSLGFFTEYRWAFSIEEAAAALVAEGPEVFGIPWYTGMFSWDSKFEIRPTGTLAGAHAILARGFYPAGSAVWMPTLGRSLYYDYPVFRFRNSWGKSWGSNGDCVISVDSLRQLMQEWGECMVPVGRRTLSPPPPAPVI